MGLSNANGHSGAQGDQSPRGGCTHACVTRLLMLLAVLSAAHVEAHVGPYARTLILRSIPVATALSSQTITFPALSRRTYGVPPFMVSATASSGLPVSLASLTLPVCTVSGNTVTIVAAGTCTIRASQAGNAKYSAAPNVDQSFTVSPALSAQTIAFGVLGSQTFGAVPFAISATASSGLPVSFASLTAPVCTLSGNTVSIVAAGTCTIEASQAGNATDAAAPDVDQSFQVTSNPGPAPPGLVLTPTLTYAVGSVPKAFAVADFNGDGKPDMAVINESSSTVSILLGGGNGAFAAATTLVAGAVPTQIVAGDFNGDGKSDLAVTNLLNNSVWVYLGNGDGTFQFPATVDVGVPAYGLAASDLNGDGKLDLVVTNAAGGATGHTLQVLLGKGDGTFLPAVAYAIGSDPFAVAIGDLNRDGALDLVVANHSSHDFSTLLGNGSGAFQPAMTIPVGPLAGPAAIVTGDFNGDGKLDVAIVDSQANTVSIFLGRGDGTFAIGGTLATGNGPVGISIADFNGDGQPDLAVSDKFDSNLSVFLGKGDGTFQPPVLLSLGLAPSPIASSDFYGNGKPDLVIGNAFASSITIVRNETSMPGALVTLGGTPQNAPANTVYPIALSAGVRDAANNPLSGRVVTFVAPSSGASGTFAGGIQGAHVVSDASGVATAPTFTANGTSGAFSVLAGVGSLSTSFILTNEAAATQAPTFTSAPPPNGFLNGPYSYLLTAAGAPPPTFSMVASALPPGLALNSASGLINGTPTMAGTFAGTLKAANGINPSATQGFVITIAAGSQIITFASLGNQMLGAAPVPVSASASSGLVVTFSSLTPSVCTVTTTVNGTTVAFIAIGTCTLRASQGGNANYAAAPSVDQSFAITLASQTIAFSTLSDQPLGPAPLTLHATASSGLTVAFASLTTTICAVNGTAVTLVSHGACTIRASQAGDAMHSAAPNVDQSFAVTMASQTITFVIITPPTTSLPSSDYMNVIGARASSGLPVSFTSLTPTVCRIDVNLMLLLRAGTCTVRASQAGDSDYSAAPNVDQSFPVTAATQRIAFWPVGDHFRTDPPIRLSASATSGFPVSFSSLTPSVCQVTGSIATLLTSGTCTLRASQPGSVDFLSATADQSFTISFFSPPAPPSAFTGPLLEYSAYLGSSNRDTAFDVVVGPDGSAYVGGSVARADFPGLSSATFTNGGLDLLYVTKIGANNANLNFATVVGGRAPDITNTGTSAYVGALQPRSGSILGGGQVEAMAKDLAGNVYVAAYANSTQFPVSAGRYSRTGPKYIFKVAPSGAVQPISAAIDPAVSTIRALAVDSNGSVYFTGVAAPGLITGPSAVIPSIPTGTVVAPYLIKLAPGGATTVFATYLSIHGSRPGTRRPADVAGFPIDSETTAYALAVDASGNSYLAGQANADDFPVTPGSAAGHSYDTQFRDAFVAKLNPTGTAFVFVARLDGGRNDEDRATSIALAPDGGIVIGGKSAAEPFYGFGTAFQNQVVLPPHLDSDREIGFIAKLLSDGSDWQFVAPIGAHGGNLVGRVSFSISDPRPVKVGVDGSGAIYAAGTAFTADSLPVLSNIPGVTPGGAFIMKLSPDGSRQIYSTTLGSGVATGLALDAFGNAYVTGYNSYLTSLNQMPVLINGEVISSGDYDVSSVFITKINDQVAPLIMAADHNPGTAGQPVNLVARLGDSRHTGTIEFRNGSQVVGTVATDAGLATLPLTFAAGIYRLSAVFHGGGPFDGIAGPELVQVINQAAP